MTTSPGGAESARAAAERFPCPKCGAGLAYDPAVRGLRCPFCGETRTIDAGGKVLVERQEIPGMGAIALFEDPDGRVLGLWQA
ncbi:MAG: hypothetical protein HUU06_12960, partial [Planctomycetaceae bacterium]|nr:hypothetical protein [Planctomycetaceae bacterium]